MKLDGMVEVEDLLSADEIIGAFSSYPSFENVVLYLII